MLKKQVRLQEEQTRLAKKQAGESECFFTTACVMHKGLSDNCYELETLRKFRDEYVQKTIDGKKLVREYYQIAPKILEKIYKTSEKSFYLNYIYKEITKIIQMIENKKKARAMDSYKAMVRKLQKQFLEK